MILTMLVVVVVVGGLLSEYVNDVSLQGTALLMDGQLPAITMPFSIWASNNCLVLGF